MQPENNQNQDSAQNTQPLDTSNNGYVQPVEPQDQSNYQSQQLPQPVPTQFQQPMQPQSNQPSPAPAVQDAHNSGTFVLQWLTYAFWGWTVLAMSFLVTSVVYNFVSGNDDSGFAVFGVASVLILLPISVICDIIYAKQEPAKKVGPASIIMVIHAVIFALFGIAALVTAVVATGFLLTSSSDGSGSKVTLISALIIAMFYGLVFVRTMFAEKIPLYKRFFVIGMVVIVGVIAALGVFGPVAKERKTRTDRLIRDNLSSLNSQINAYTDENKKLPENLSVLDLNGDAKKLVDEKLVKYTPNTKQPEDDPVFSDNFDNRSTLQAFNNNMSKNHFYGICANFVADSTKDQGQYEIKSPELTDKDGYTDYPSFYTYKKGETCYKIKHLAYNY